MSTFDNIRVELNGQSLIWMKEESSPNGALAYPEHLGADGEIADLHTALFADSYAHVIDGTIWRCGSEIGTVEDLVFV